MDGDGDLDVLVVNGNPNSRTKNAMYINDGGGIFQQVTEGSNMFVNGSDHGVSSGLEVVDIDGDGDLDVLVSNLYIQLGIINDNAMYLNDGGGGLTQVLDSTFRGLDLFTY